MKTKHFIFIIILGYAASFIIRFIILIDFYFQIDPILHGLIVGVINALKFIAFIGLFYKIYKYHDKDNLLNS